MTQRLAKAESSKKSKKKFRVESGKNEARCEEVVVQMKDEYEKEVRKRIVIPGLNSVSETTE